MMLGKWHPLLFGTLTITRTKNAAAASTDFRRVSFGVVLPLGML